MEDSLSVHKICQYQGHNASIYCLVDGGDDSPYFYSAGGDGWIVQWSKSGSETDGLLIANTDAKIFAMHLDTSRNLMVVGDINGHTHWIDMVSKKILNRIIHHKSSIFGFCQVDDFIYSVSGDGYICKWSLQDRQPLESTFISHQGLRDICYDASKGLLYIGASDNGIHIVQLTDLTVVNRIPNAHENSVFCLAIVGNQYLISGGRDAHLNVRSMSDMTINHSIGAHWFTINDVIYVSSSEIIATASRDKTIRLWDATDFQLLKSIDVQKGGHINSVNALLWLEKHQTLVSASDDRMINLWEVVRV